MGPPRPKYVVCLKRHASRFRGSSGSAPQRRICGAIVGRVHCVHIPALVVSSTPILRAAASRKRRPTRVASLHDLNSSAVHALPFPARHATTKLACSRDKQANLRGSSRYDAQTLQGDVKSNRSVSRCYGRRRYHVARRCHRALRVPMTAAR